MKAKITALLLALTCSAQATLIDLTPGGFRLLDPPKVYLDWQQNHYKHDSFKMAFNNIFTPGGWDSHFLGPPLFNVTPLGGLTATLSWDLTGRAFIFNYLFVGTGPNGWINMYRVSSDQQKVGEAVITINDLYNITGIGIYGLRIPDDGGTILMFGLSVACIVCMRFWRQTSLERSRMSTGK